MLEQVPDLKPALKGIGHIMEGKGGYSSIEERDRALDILINHVSDRVLSILLREYKEGLNYFLNEK